MVVIDPPPPRPLRIFRKFLRDSWGKNFPVYWGILHWGGIPYTVNIADPLSSSTTYFQPSGLQQGNLLKILRRYRGNKFYLKKVGGSVCGYKLFCPYPDLNISLCILYDQTHVLGQRLYSWKIPFFQLPRREAPNKLTVFTPQGIHFSFI